MFHIYNILLLLLTLFFTYSLSINIKNDHSNRTISSSRSIYDLVQLRRTAARLAAYRNKTDHQHPDNTNDIYPYASKSTIVDAKTEHNRFFIERLKIIIIISSIALGFMIIIVITCIIARYIQNKNPKPTERRPEKKNPLNSSNRTTRFSQIHDNKRKFTRKPRTLPIDSIHDENRSTGNRLM